MTTSTNQPVFRYMNLAAGGFILVILLLSAVLVFQSGRIQEWFHSGNTLKVMLPIDGLFGLSEGSQVEILGTNVGKVNKIVIRPDQRMHAEVRIRKDFMLFVRADSRGFIKKRFGVAGATYLEVTRGEGKPIDWGMAVIDADADKAPTETMQLMLEEIREKILPAIGGINKAITEWTRLAEKFNDPRGNLSQMVSNLNDVSSRLNRGEGSAGRLLSDDALVKNMEVLVVNLIAKLDRIDPILTELQRTSKDLTQLTGNLKAGSKEVPELTKTVNRMISDLSAVLTDVKKSTGDLPHITGPMADASKNLPGLVLQAQETMRELQKLIKKLQSHWLLGSGPGSKSTPKRISPLESGR